MPENTRAPDAKGETIPAQGERNERVPKQPHERDESAGSQAPGGANQRKMGRIAHDDVAEGLVDTDKGPVLDATYEPMRQDREPGRRDH